jgi:hypothetical protein
VQFLQLKREQLYDWSRVSDMHFRHLAKEAKAPRNNFTVRPAKAAASCLFAFVRECCA